MFYLPIYLALFVFRYLGGTSTTYVALGLYFARGESTIANIVAETTKKIWETLMNTYMAVPDTNKWKQIAERYYTLWNMPNCLGSLDGKHFKIKKYPNTGSANFNYKNYNSVILMACADADGLFTMIEVGYAGRNSDAGIFRVSHMKRLIESDALNIPAPARLPLDENNYSFPFYFVGDEAFPLEKYLMRPFPGRNATNTSRVFNYRLSRARKSVECTFGMLTEKFMLFESPIRCRNPEVVNNIIKSACVLHNFVRSKEGMSYQATNISGGTSQRPNGIIPHELILGPNPSSLALRKYLNNYFLAPQTALQWAYCI